MQTFRNLPTMQPSAKKHSDQKLNGTSDQLCASKMASMPINKIPQIRLNCQRRGPPLTPALSPEERGNRSQSPGKTAAASGSINLKKTETAKLLSPLPGGEGQGEGKNDVNAHKCFVPARGASRQAARVGPSRAQTPLPPDGATSQGRSRSGSRRLSQPQAAWFPPDDKSCHKPRAFVSTRIVFHPAARRRPPSSQARWHSKSNPRLLSENRPRLSLTENA